VVGTLRATAASVTKATILRRPPLDVAQALLAERAAVAVVGAHDLSIGSTGDVPSSRDRHAPTRLAVGDREQDAVGAATVISIGRVLSRMACGVTVSQNPRRGRAIAKSVRCATWRFHWCAPTVLQIAL
jgi:hypothetical protein